MSERIVVTGMGAVTPIGVGVNSYWSALTSGKCGVRTITQYDVDELPVKIAAEVPDFHPEDHMTKKLVNRTDPFTQYALAAAGEALKDIKIDNPERTGIVMGSAVNGIRTVTRDQERLTKTGNHRRVNPYLMPAFLANVTAAHIAIINKLNGPSLTVCTACSSGVDAIGLATEKLKADEADMMVAAGAESIMCPLVIDSLHNLHALSANNEEPCRASRPFDKDRDGFVIGEGAGILILETLTHAQKRGAAILAEIVGYANLGSAFHVTAPEPNGRFESLCMKKALDKAGLHPADIDYINAHGTATPIGDRVEIKAMKRTFNHDLGRIPISSTKGATGHMMGAGGITEAITCIKVIEEGILPPTLNLETREPGCDDLDFVPQKARNAEVNIAMTNSFGFGGQNASLIIRRFEE